jgi:hypothetical protein
MRIIAPVTVFGCSKATQPMPSDWLAEQSMPLGRYLSSSFTGRDKVVDIIPNWGS